MGASLYLILALFAAIPSTYGYMWVKQQVAVKRAIDETRNQGVEACNIRVGIIEEANRRAVSEAIRRALDAEANTEATPETSEELKALCERSASCRSKASK